MLTTLDYTVIVIYLLAVAFFGIRIAGRQVSADDYFLGGRDLPWWVVCISIVATETSTLTVIGLPAISYGGTLAFLQLTLGYLVGRTVVSFVLLPRYHERRLVTTYEYLGHRYGDTMRGTASITFLITRLLADGVRLFASAIPLKVIAMAAGFDISYLAIIFVLGMVTISYTLIGGIRAVVWMDVVQLFVYLAGGLLAIVVLLGTMPPGWWNDVVAAGKATTLDLGLSEGMAGWLTEPYLLPAALIGGAVFSVGSHGTDQLIVQRLLACRSLRGSQVALIGSAVIVMVQFLMFLIVGLLLWRLYDGVPPAELGLSRTDEVFPMFIVEGLPAGVSGLLLAGIIAAAMSTLSSTVNSLASSTLFDLVKKNSLGTSRWLTFLWGAVLIVFASLFEDSDNAVIELGLTIASYTYGAQLGVFALSLLVPSSRQPDALIAFFTTIVAMVLIIVGVRYSADTGFVFALGEGSGLSPLAWLWYPVIGAVITVATGAFTALLRRLSGKAIATETGDQQGAEN